MEVNIDSILLKNCGKEELIKVFIWCWVGDEVSTQDKMALKGPLLLLSCCDVCFLDILLCYKQPFNDITLVIGELVDGVPGSFHIFLQL